MKVTSSFKIPIVRQIQSSFWCRFFFKSTYISVCYTEELLLCTLCLQDSLLLSVKFAWPVLTWMGSSPESMQAQQRVLMLHLRKSLSSVNRAVQLLCTKFCDKMTALSMRSIDHRLIFSNCAFVTLKESCFSSV